MLSIAAKQSIKRFIAKTTKSFISNNKKLSVILNYHSIHPTHKFATKPDDFASQMKYIASNFSTISLSDFYKMRTTKRDLSGRLAMVTFDDGYEDNYYYAFPILKEFEIQATIFVTTGFVEGDVDIAKKDRTYSGLKPLTWGQITEMKEWGVSFGAHTHTHPILTQVSLKSAEDEIIKSKDILESRLKAPVALFAFPLGQPSTINDDIIELLKKHGFKLACSTIWGLDNSVTDLFALLRIRIDAVDTFDDFKEKINGNWDFIRWIQMLKGKIGC